MSIFVVPLTSPQHNAVLASAMPSACEKSGQWEQTLSLMADMKGQEDLVPDSYMCSTAMMACSKAVSQLVRQVFFCPHGRQSIVPPRTVVFRFVLCTFRCRHVLHTMCVSPWPVRNPCCFLSHMTLTVRDAG